MGEHWLIEKYQPLIQQLPGLSDRYRVLLETTVLTQIVYFDNKANENKKYDNRFSLWVITAGIVISLLSPLALMDGLNNLSIITGLLGAGISLISKLQDRFKYAETYQTARKDCEDCLYELRSLLYQSGDYTALTVEDGVKRCHRRIEKINQGSVSKTFEDGAEEESDLIADYTDDAEVRQRATISRSPSSSYREPSFSGSGPSQLYGGDDCGF